MDVLILNTAVVDFRSKDFQFANELVGLGGLVKCPNDKAPELSQAQLAAYIQAGQATVGGPGNAAPLIAKAGLDVAVGVNLGAGPYDGLDAAGRFFNDVLAEQGVDMNHVFVHPTMATGATFICPMESGERGGLAFFAHANDDFDFAHWRQVIERTQPKIVYYMYVGLSERGDANDGRDLAEFLEWCRRRDIVTLMDTVTLAKNPQEAIQSGHGSEAYRLLEPVIRATDVFLTSSDEAYIIANTFGLDYGPVAAADSVDRCLEALAGYFWDDDAPRTRLFGTTVPDGAHETHVSPATGRSRARKVASRFLFGEVVDLVGAGDSFRAGLTTYLARHLDQYHTGQIDFDNLVQMGNLFASLYIKTPLHDRFRYFQDYEKLAHLLDRSEPINSMAELDELMA